MKAIEQTIEKLKKSGNFRTIPSDLGECVDLSSNDYLGIAEDKVLAEIFLNSLRSDDFLMTSSASRLLATRQEDYFNLEQALSEAYDRPALIFNSGYHANTGIVKALADKNTLFLADKLVHASIIDGLSMAQSAGATFLRFRHNDFNHLRHLMEVNGKNFDRVVIIAESVYSMDGDRTNLDELIHVRNMHPGGMIYLDEAHSVGVLGSQGLGIARNHPDYNKIDIVVGTFGKALASMGAFAVVSEPIKEYLVNMARPLIFSTALPPLNVRWTLTTFRHAMKADEARLRLAEFGKLFGSILGTNTGSHIQPLIIGSPERAVEASRELMAEGFRVLPIRTPTVPQGTDRLRFSLSAALPDEILKNNAVHTKIKEICCRFAKMS